VPPRTALIVGAGIGGLSAAIALRQAGWQVRVFERASSPRELGFGLGLAPNAVEALRALGVADEVLARGFAPRRGEIRRMDGTVLKRADLVPGALGGPFLIALRPALHGALLDAVGSDALTLDREATTFAVSGDRVMLQFARGPGVEGHLLVGADGLGSVVRRAIHPAERAPRSSGLIAVRGAVHGVLAHLGDLSAVYYLGPGVESVFIRASETGIYWFLSLARELVPASLTEASAIVTHMAPRFDATFRAITSATSDLRVDELADRDPLPFWGRGVVTLLGDAAHPVLPHTGQGAAQAMVDAVALGRVLRPDAPVEPALRAYEDDRRRKTAALLARGRRTARMMRMTSPVGCALRELGIRLIPVTALTRLAVGISRRAGTDVTDRQAGSR
jgi:2-polyprenyl-6-methoxyphenol hydroxylase-like FAD-dependent oxidoreductase